MSNLFFLKAPNTHTHTHIMYLQLSFNSVYIFFYFYSSFLSTFSNFEQPCQ